MCYNCGCGVPEDDMGHPENITEDKIKKAASVNDQSVEDAKKNMLDLLKKEVGE